MRNSEVTVVLKKITNQIPLNPKEIVLVVLGKTEVEPKQNFGKGVTIRRHVLHRGVKVDSLEIINRYE